MRALGVIVRNEFLPRSLQATLAQTGSTSIGTSVLLIAPIVRRRHLDWETSPVVSVRLRLPPSAAYRSVRKTSHRDRARHIEQTVVHPPGLSHCGPSAPSMSWWGAALRRPVSAAGSLSWMNNK